MAKSDLTMVEWDVVKHASGLKMEPVKSQAVAVIVSATDRYIISIDQEEKGIVIYRTGILRDSLTIEAISSNKIMVK